MDLRWNFWVRGENGNPTLLPNQTNMEVIARGNGRFQRLIFLMLGPVKASNRFGGNPNSFEWCCLNGNCSTTILGSQIGRASTVSLPRPAKPILGGSQALVSYVLASSEKTSAGAPPWPCLTGTVVTTVIVFWTHATFSLSSRFFGMKYCSIVWTICLFQSSELGDFILQCFDLLWSNAFKSNIPSVDEKPCNVTLWPHQVAPSPKGNCIVFQPPIVGVLS